MMNKKATPTIDPQDVEDSLNTPAIPEKELAEADLFSGFVDAGTEEVTQEDLNTPYLVLMQKLTDIDGVKPGWYYRSDTKEMFETVDVNFIYITTKTKFNERKNMDEIIKQYWGFYAGTVEPFKINMKGWGISAHREFQTMVALYKKKFGIPMFALTVRLSSEDKEGKTKANEAYKIKKIVCEVLKDSRDPAGVRPLVERNPEKIGFLVEAIDRFKKISAVAAINPETDIPEDA